MYILQASSSWFTHIDPLDKKLFFIVNSRWSNGFFDALLPFLRESTIWVPLYLFMLVFAVSNFGKRGWIWFLFAICTAAICDLVSSHLIKGVIFRLRPCQNPDMADLIHVRANYCPHSSSFTSSHATTHFGLAIFVVLSLQRSTSPWIKLFYVWAGIISYAQVYVGVHYPFDVFCGGLLGSLLGYVMARSFNNYIGLSSSQFKSVS